MNNNEWVTTAFGFESHKIVKNLGVVRGITVRSRSIVGSFGAHQGEDPIDHRRCAQDRTG
jgi:hypothetical protein